MNHLVPYASQFRELLTYIISSDELHAKWLNTLSFLENCGARKIAACEHPTLVREEMLKHAAEEFRHAHYLKRQITRVTSRPFHDYSLDTLLGSTTALHYLFALDIKASKYLLKQRFSKKNIKEIAYLLVTYAIELRAEELYPIYDEALRKTKSKVNVKSILMEEKEHLNEMREGLQKIRAGFRHAKKICEIEGECCKKWLDAISKTHFNKLSIL